MTKLTSKKGHKLSLSFGNGGVIPVGTANFKLPNGQLFYLRCDNDPNSDVEGENEPVDLTVRLADQTQTSFPLRLFPGGSVSYDLVAEVISAIPVGKLIKWSI